MLKNQIIIFGTSGKLGSAICELARETCLEIIGVGRSIGSNCTEEWELDFTDTSEIIKMLSKIKISKLKGIIFCQRSRENPENEVDDLYRRLQVELNPILATKSFLNKIKQPSNINLVTITSNASSMLNIDVDYNYHIIKSSVLHAGMALSMINSKANIFSNAISFGEVVDTRITNHNSFKKKIFNKLGSISPTKKIASLQDVAQLALQLMDAEKINLNNQIITLDGGINMISQDAIIRSIGKKYE